MSKDSLKSRVLFDKIRYSNVWEDAEILIKGLNVKQGDNIFSIASGGDNCFAMASKGANVYCLDISFSQLACVELKKISIKYLSRDDVLKFFGIIPCKNRLKIYSRLTKYLSHESRKFWNENLDSIIKGFIHSGKFEKYFSYFRNYILPLIHNKKNIDKLLTKKDKNKRKEFYNNTWANKRWFLLFQIFFGKFVMGNMGRDPEFFRYVDVPVSQSILKRAEYALTELETDNNPYLTYILKGNYENNLPFYLKKENFNNLKSNIDNIYLFQGYAEEVLEKAERDCFDGFNLSDIFEYLDEKTCEDLYEKLLNKSKKGSKLAYWNMLVPRSLPEKFKGRVEYKEELSNRLFNEDKAFFYSRFIIDEVIDAS